MYLVFTPLPGESYHSWLQSFVVVFVVCLSNAFNSCMCAACFYFTIAHLHFKVNLLSHHALYRWLSASLLLSRLPSFFFSPGNWKPSSVLPSPRPRCVWQRSPQMRTWMKRCDCSRCLHWMLPTLATWQVRKSDAHSDVLLKAQQS